MIPCKANKVETKHIKDLNQILQMNYINVYMYECIYAVIKNQQRIWRRHKQIKFLGKNLIC